MNRSSTFALGAAFALCACASQTTLTPAAQTAVQAGVTLATVAANSNSTVASLVVKGQTFCNGYGGVVALVNTLSSPTSVIGIGSDIVRRACAAIGGVPVAPPTNVPQDKVPVVVAPAPVLPSQPTS